MKAATKLGASGSAVRQHNIQVALRALHRMGPMSRADLARDMGLNRSSSGHIIGHLLQEGYVRETNCLPSSGRQMGRPGIMLELVPEALYFLGVEIGVAHVSTVVLDFTGAVVQSERRLYDTRGEPPAAVVEDILRDAFASLGADMLARLRGIALAIPAHIDPGGHLRLAPQIGWQDFAIQTLVRKLIPSDVAIRIENDANALAIGHDYREFHPGVTLFLLMETGIGGGIVVNGELFRGGRGLAGEIGHLRFPRSVPGQEQGERYVSLEDLIGKDALVCAYRGASGEPLASFDGFLAAVSDRVPEAVIIAEEWAKTLAQALCQTIRTIDPNRIVLGGCVSALYRFVGNRVQHHLMRVDPEMTEPPRILVEGREQFGAAFGAACIMHKEFLSRES